MKSYVNLGCGARFHESWLNFDMHPSSSNVVACDLAQGIPLEDNRCDVVYHSDLIEHIRRDKVVSFLRECYRVLKPEGIMRVATPDFEEICRQYLQKLEAVISGDHLAKPDYEWMMVECLDQFVREKSGGEMLSFLSQDPLPGKDFIFERIGVEGRELVKCIRNAKNESLSESRLEPNIFFHIWRRYSEGIKTRILKLLIGSDGLRALDIGRFRLAGEVHQWAYDKYSLKELLLKAGFCNVTIQSAARSTVPDWSSFHLDVLSDGLVIKPDSLFLEAIKPPDGV